MTERPTPESDAAAIEASGHCDDDGEGQAVVGIRFARRLERERDELSATVTLLSKVQTGLIAERDALREALRPFAALLQAHNEYHEDDRPVFGINGANITISDLRRARSLLREAT